MPLTSSRAVTSVTPGRKATSTANACGPLGGGSRGSAVQVKVSVTGSTSRAAQSRSISTAVRSSEMKNTRTITQARMPEMPKCGAADRISLTRAWRGPLTSIRIAMWPQRSLLFDASRRQTGSKPTAYFSRGMANFPYWRQGSERLPPRAGRPLGRVPRSGNEEPERAMLRCEVGRVLAGHKLQIRYYTMAVNIRLSPRPRCAAAQSMEEHNHE